MKGKSAKENVKTQSRLQRIQKRNTRSDYIDESIIDLKTSTEELKCLANLKKETYRIKFIS